MTSAYQPEWDGECAAQALYDAEMAAHARGLDEPHTPADFAAIAAAGIAYRAAHRAALLAHYCPFQSPR